MRVRTLGPTPTLLVTRTLTRYTTQWLKQHRKARPGCKHNQPWACSPTHMPYTSGALGGPRFDPAERFETGGGWGNVWVRAIGT